MKRLLLIVAALAAVGYLSGESDTPLQAAAVAWDRGDYTTALKRTSRSWIHLGPAALEPIALQTGELYKTLELTRDGDAPIFSPDSRRVAFETGRASPARPALFLLTARRGWLSCRAWARRFPLMD